MKSSNIFDFLKSRGYIYQFTNEKTLRDLFSKEKVTIYQGFDPTSDSLQIGNFLGVMAMSHLQKAGHQPIFLVGGFTVIVGDPAGQTKERPLLPLEKIEKNSQAIKHQVQNMGLLDFNNEKSLLLNNTDWLDTDLKTYLRKVTRHISVSQLLSHETFKKRLGTQVHLSVMELLYSTLQAWDFLHLYQNFNCKVQMGGADQWTNMLDGVDLIQNSLHEKAHCFTLPLLTDSKNQKLGKTAAGQKIWLDPNKTSPFDFYQYFRNIEDEKVPQLLRLLTFLDDEEIAEIEKGDKKVAQERLAFEITKIVHGENETKKVQKGARSIFVSEPKMDLIPKVEIDKQTKSCNIIDLMLETKLISSKVEGKRLIQQEGVKVNGIVVHDRNFQIKPEKETECLITIGKKALILKFI